MMSAPGSARSTRSGWAGGASGDASRVGALWVVRGTRRNRALIGSLPELFTSRFPASSHDWLRALGDSAAPMPADPDWYGRTSLGRALSHGIEQAADGEARASNRRRRRDRSPAQRSVAGAEIGRWRRDRRWREIGRRRRRSDWAARLGRRRGTLAGRSGSGAVTPSAATSRAMRTAAPGRIASATREQQDGAARARIAAHDAGQPHRPVAGTARTRAGQSPQPARVAEQVDHHGGHDRDPDEDADERREVGDRRGDRRRGRRRQASRRRADPRASRGSRRRRCRRSGATPRCRSRARRRRACGRRRRGSSARPGRSSATTSTITAAVEDLERRLGLFESRRLPSGTSARSVPGGMPRFVSSHSSTACGVSNDEKSGIVTDAGITPAVWRAWRAV